MDQILQEKKELESLSIVPEKEDFSMLKSIGLSIVTILLVSASVKAASVVIAPLILLIYLSKQKYAEALIFFIVCLFFSDSAMPIYYYAGNSGKDIMMLILGIYTFLSKNIKKDFTLLKYLTPFFLVAILSTLLAEYQNIIGYQKLLSYFLLVAMAPSFISTIVEQKKISLFFKTLTYIFTGLFILSISMKYLGDINFNKFEGRFNGIQRNPNGVGIFVSIFIMFLYTLNKQLKIFTQKKVWLITSVFLIALLLAGSRTSIITLIIFFGLNFLNKGFLFNLITVSTFIFLYENVVELAVTFAQSYGLQQELRVDTISYASGRIYIWQAAKLHIAEAPWLGYGFAYDEFSGWWKDYIINIPELIHNFGNTHSTYYTFGLNIGISGTLAFFIGLFFFLAKNKNNILLISLLSAMFLAFYESWMTASLNPFTIIFFLMFSGTKLD